MKNRSRIHSKQNLKQRFPYLWMEVLILAIIAIFFVTTWRAEDGENKRAYYEHIEQLDASVESLRTMQGVTADTITAELYDKNVFMNHMGFALEFYDIDGNPLSRTPDEKMWIYWQPTASDQTRIFFLEHYFTDEQLQPLLENETLGNVYQIPVSMTGYYDKAGELILAEVMFYVFETGVDEPDTLMIKNKIPEDIADDELLLMTTGTSMDDIPVEIGEGSFRAVQLDATMTEKAYEYLESREKHWVGILNSFAADKAEGSSSRAIDAFKYHVSMEVEGNFFRAAVVYAPIKLILESNSFWLKLIPFVILCQGGALAFFFYQKVQRDKKRMMEQMQSTFINAMAHEMKTPAAVIRNSAECMQENINPEKNPHYLQMIVKESERMNELLMNMILYTKTNNGIYELQKQEISLVDMVQDVCNDYKLAMEYHGMSLEIQKNTDNKIMADPSLIRAVVSNYVSNAVKHGKEDGKIVIHVYDGGCSVYNDGEHLSAKALDQVWEPLYVADASRTDQKGNAGMGLAICRNILELHGAKYGVENIAGGVRFFFELP